MESTEHLLVTAGIIIRKKPRLEILITQRPSPKTYSPNLWEFPGGKVHEHENPQDGLVREIKEELGLTVTPGKLFMKHTHSYVFSSKKITVDLRFYFCTILRGSLTLLDCQDARWVCVHDLNTFTFCDADLPVIQKLLEIFGDS